MAKLEYGICNLHYALYVNDTYSIPIKIGGIADANISPVVHQAEFRGLDGIPINQEEFLGGYDGTLSIYNCPTLFLEKVWGYDVRDDGLIVEKSGAANQRCAIMYETAGTDRKRYVYYNCTFKRPDHAIETIARAANIQKIKIAFSARAAENNAIRLICPQDNPNYSSFFNGVII